MKTFKGTPGPWILAKEASEGDFGLVKIGQFEISGHDFYNIESDVENLEEEQSNLKAIAAVPDLLGALQRLIVAAKPHAVATSQLQMRITEAEFIISKALD